MNKKIILSSIFATVLLSSVGFIKYERPSFSDETIRFDVDVIQALSHKNGETVNFVNNNIEEYWNSDASDYEALKTLYEMNSEIESFAKNSYNPQYVRDLYATWDDFKPVNNTLSWRSNVRANSYDIVVSLNGELTEAVYEQKGLTDTCYTMENPYANTHYFWQVTAHTDNGPVKSTIFDFYSGDYKRTVDIPTVSNTRDVGGFTGSFGVMKQGLIYRSARLDDIDDSGLAVINSLGIQTDLDLRAKGEGKENPAKLTNYYLTSIPGSGYSSALTEANRAVTVEAIRVFADPNNYPVVFHCAVGRDRTGTIGIILQALCGASLDYIIHDYYTSMWSVTGAYSKSLTDLNLNAVTGTIAALTNNGQLSLVEGAEKFLKVKKDSSTGTEVGLTDQEIQSIRDIWSGVTPVEHAPKPFKASENYEGRAFVKIQAIGHKDIAMIVNKGTVLNAPYELDAGLGWFINKTKFDFATSINETTLIYADYLMDYSITIHFVGVSKKDITIQAKSGEVLVFSSYEMDGYDMVVLLDTGKQISKLEVARDAYVNILYFKK